MVTIDIQKGRLNLINNPIFFAGTGGDLQSRLTVRIDDPNPLAHSACHAVRVRGVPRR